MKKVCFLSAALIIALVMPSFADDQDRTARNLGYNYKIVVGYYEPQPYWAASPELKIKDTTTYYAYIFRLDETFTKIGLPSGWHYRYNESKLAEKTMLRIDMERCIEAKNISTDLNEKYKEYEYDRCGVTINGMQGFAVIYLLYYDVASDYENTVVARVVFNYPHPITTEYLNY